MGETEHDQPTSLADGRYLLVEQLGEGGMASVFRAFDQRLQVWRAIKILLPQYADKKKIARRFEAEAQTMALLEHRHIVRVYDVGRDGANIAYIVMELVEGGCLVDWLEHHGPMPARMAVRATQEVCYGLAAAHAKGIIHRDVKPHNVMVTRDGVCRVTDFGIARVGDSQNSQTKTGSVMGTWGYMAPEQRTNAKGVDERSDVYAVGATLYTLLTDRMPMDLFAAERNASILEGIEEPLISLLIKSTEYDRDDRFANVTEFAEALEEVFDQLSPIPEGTAPLALDAPPEPARPDPTAYKPATEIGTDGRPISNPTLMPSGEDATDVGAPTRQHAAMTMAPDEVPMTDPGAGPRQNVPVYDPSKGPDPAYDPNQAETIVRDPSQFSTGIPIDRSIAPPPAGDSSTTRNAAIAGAATAIWGVIGVVILLVLLVAIAWFAVLRPEPKPQPTGPVVIEKPVPTPTPTPDPVEPTPQPVEPTPTPVRPTPTPVRPVPTPVPDPVVPTPQPVEPVPQPVEPDPEPVPDPEPPPCVKAASPVAWNSARTGVLFKFKQCQGEFPSGKRVVLHYNTGDSWMSKPLGEVSRKWTWKLPADQVDGTIKWYVDGEMGTIGSRGNPEVFVPQ